MINKNLESIRVISLHVYREWILDRTVRLGAGVAYYMLIALVPLVTLAIGMASIVFSAEDINQYVVESLATTFGGSVDTIASALNSLFTDVELANSLRSIGLVGVAGIVVSVSFLVVALQDAMNVIWKLPVKRGLKISVTRYAAAYGVVLLISSTVLLSLLVHSATQFAVSITPGDFNIVEYAARILSSVISFALTVGLLALLTKIMLKVQVGVRELIVSAMITAVLLQVGISLLGLYFASAISSTAAGVFGGVLLALAWMYYIAQILLVGVQITKVLSYRAGNPYLQKKLMATDPQISSTNKK